MNAFLDARYSETVHRLAAGIAPTDAVRGTLVAAPLTLDASVPFERHSSGRFALRRSSRVTDAVDVVLSDARRRYVPRRLRFPIAAGDVPASERTWFPALYPGANYALTAPAAAVRAAAQHAGAPARWARITATAAGTTRVVGRAHGDDRGEFLLLVAPDPAAPAELPAHVGVTITVRARPAAAGGGEDPYWDLPLETAGVPGPGDPVAEGLHDPPGYTLMATRDVELVPGRALTGVDPFDLA